MKKHNVLKEGLLKVTEKAVRHEMEVSLYGWPPKCGSLLYQPKRPEVTTDKKEKES